jgi:plastocyanin
MGYGKFVCGFAIVAALAAAGCKGDSPGGPSGGGGSSCATITIANNTVTPNAVTVARGCQVTFVNNDSQSHNMRSDPHPEHTNCPPINDVGLVNPGRSGTTGNLNTAGTCGFHDHDLASVAGLRGTIVIQ